MVIRWHSISILLLFSFFGNGQSWRSPIDFPIRLSGTFCELRTNHFHHGIDIKSSKGVSGDPIYSIGDATLHRLRVQGAGYGLSVYLKHPEGYVSVYGHLQKFSPKLDSIVRHYQYKKMSYEVDINCDSLSLHILKGELIGNMGSSGYSFGPHLHFEIRDAKTEVTINPLLFNFEIVDNTKPTLSEIRFDYLATDGRKYAEKRIPVLAGKNKSSIKGDTVRIGAWRLGLALRTKDFMHKTPNQNGVYGIQIFIDSIMTYNFRGDSMHFHESRAVNILKDVASYKKAKERWYLAYNLPGSPLKSYALSTKNNGWITPYENKPQRVTVVISDVSGNERKLEFYILRNSEMKEQSMPGHNYFFPYNEPNVIRLNGIELSCADSTFYRDQYILVDVDSDSKLSDQSSTMSLYGDVNPFHRPCTLSFDIPHFDTLMQAKAIGVRCDADTYYNVGGTIADSRFRALISTYGEYSVIADRIAPSLEIVKYSNVMTNGDEIVVKIADQYESKGRGKEVSVNATINGRWICMAHDVKSNRFSYTLRDLSPGPHTLRVEYQDAVGNIDVWEKEFKILK